MSTPNVVPVAIAGRDEPRRAAAAVLNPKTILIATDFSGTSDLAIEAARNYASAFACSLHLLHVYEIPALWGLRASTTNEAQCCKGLAAKARARLKRRAELIRDANISCEYSVRRGVPVVEILDLAREINAELIVAGSRHRSGIAHALLGSVAQQLVQASDRPVLVVR